MQQLQTRAAFCEFLRSKRTTRNEDSIVDGAEGDWSMFLQKSLIAWKRSRGEMAFPPAHGFKYHHQSGVNAELKILI